ncbi:MAG: FtsW/RodA/SpoVE family cell cycle protein [Candidatus Krumholzibacteriota bacterium]
MNRRLRGFTASMEHSDRLLLASVGVLLFIGIFVVYGAGSYNRAAHSSPLGQHFIVAKHLFMIGVGLVMMIGLMNLDYRWFRHHWFNWGGLGVTYGLVAWTLLIARHDPDGDRIINRWVTIAGFSFQPVEMAKLAMIFFLAERLTNQGAGRNPTPRQLGRALLLGPLPLLVLLVLQPNFGNAMVIGGVTLVLLYVAGVSGKWLLRFLAALPLLAGICYLAIPKIHRRVDKLIDGFREGDFGYQVNQSLIGLGGPGWKGAGIGQSHNKFSFLPESHTDFAFSMLGEEWGLFGTLMVVAMLILFAWRGFGIAARAADPFGKVVAAGLTTGIAIYGVANIAMVTGIFPVVGVPLPFVSFGGTAMIAALASVGILLNIERGSRSYQVWKRRWDRSGTA